MLFKKMEDISIFCLTTYTTVLDCSALGFKATVQFSLACFLTCMQYIPQIHLWCDTCWPLVDQYCSPAFLTHILVHIQALVGPEPGDRVCATVCALTVWAIDTSLFMTNSRLQRIRHHVLSKKYLPLKTISKTCFQRAFFMNTVRITSHKVKLAFILRFSSSRNVFYLYMVTSAACSNTPYYVHAWLYKGCGYYGDLSVPCNTIDHYNCV